MKDNSKTISTSHVIFIIISIALLIGMFFIVNAVVDTLKINKEEKIMSNMEKIYTSAIVVDEVAGGLNEDTGENAKYDKLSEMSGFKVYNAPKEDNYAVIKDHQRNEITVYYGEDLIYPNRNQNKISNEEVSNQDLFTYDESSGEVIITGFSEDGVDLLSSDSVIQIPETYNGREISKIANKAFYSKNLMGVVIIPEGITDIGNHAFSNNGKKGVSDSINEPGKWEIVNKKWQRID